jgi:hypothetical protein
MHVKDGCSLDLPAIRYPRGAVANPDEHEELMNILLEKLRF